MAAVGSLLGADGNSLVFSPTGAGQVTMQWFNQPVASGNLVAPQAHLDLSLIPR
jgi:hypothetical protein